MPETTPISKADTALASSVRGAIPVSAGPGAIPIADANFSWDTTNKQQTIKGQAIGAGGDRHNVQTPTGGDIVKVDKDGSMCHYMDNNTNGIATRIYPTAANSLPVSWNGSCST